MTINNCCPTCGRKLTTPKTAVDKRIYQDLAKVDAAITALQAVLANPKQSHLNGEYSDQVFNAESRCNASTAALVEAVQSELDRLTRARTDHKLLWSLYRRADKKAPYYA